MDISRATHPDAPRFRRAASPRRHSLELLEARIAPAVLSVVSIARAAGAPAATSAGTAAWTVTFSEPVAGVDATDFIVHTEQSAHAAPAVTVEAVNSTVFTVTATGLHGEGDVRLDLIDDDSITGDSGTLGGPGLSNGSFQGASYHLLQTYPTVLSITASGDTTTSASSVSWTVKLSAPVTGVDAADFTLVKGTGAHADGTVTVAGSGDTYTVTATGVSGNSTLGLRLVDDGSIRDANGNPLQTNPPPSFATPIPLPAGEGTYHVAAIDLNGDGRPDLVTANAVANTVSVRLNTAQGFAERVDYAAGAMPVSVAVADVNGDGIPDLVTANYSGHSLSVLLGDGHGGFAAKVDYPVTGAVQSVAVADVNGDGKPDLVAGNYLSFSVGVLLGDGTGAFGPKTDFATGSGARSVVVADVNGDGLPDVVTANTFARTVSVLLGDGHGSFGAHTDFATGDDPMSLTVADLDGDGHPDLVTGNLTGSSVSVLRGNGDGSFQAKTDYAVGSFVSWATVADVNGDGLPDLVVTEANGIGAVAVLLADGHGGFGAKTEFGTGQTPVFVTVSEVNGDGRPDLVVANSASSEISVLTNTGKGSFTGDVFQLTSGVDLVLTKTANVISAAPGSVIKYTLSYHNGGFVTAAGVSLADAIPANTVFDLADSTAGWKDAAGNMLADGAGAGTMAKFAVGSVAVSNTNATVTLAVRVTGSLPASADGTDNTASIDDDHASGLDLHAQDNSSTVHTTLVAAPDLRLGVMASADVVLRGQALAYTYSYTNEGTRDASGVTLRATVPAGAHFDTAGSDSRWMQSTLDPNTWLITFASLTVGTSGSAVFAVKVDNTFTAGQRYLHSDAFIGNGGANGVDPTPANNAATLETELYNGIYVLTSSTAEGVSGKASPPLVRVYDVSTGETSSFLAYDADYTKGVRVAVADLNGDGFLDIVTATRSGSGKIRAFDGRTHQPLTLGSLTEIKPFSGSSAHGAYLALGDIDSDGTPDIIASSGVGGGVIKVYSGHTGELLERLTPFGSTYNRGLRVSAGDVNGDGTVDLVAAQGSNGSKVAVYSDHATNVPVIFQAGAQHLSTGVFVSLGQVQSGGLAEIIVGRGAGSGSGASIGLFHLSGQTATEVKTIALVDPIFGKGVHVAAVDYDLDGVADIIAAASQPTTQTQVQAYAGTGAEMPFTPVTAFPDTPHVGVFVAAGSPVIA